MSKRYMVAVRNCNTASVVFPLADATNLRKLKSMLSVNLVELVLTREVASWLRPAAFTAPDSSRSMTRVPEIMWVSVHKYDSDDVKIDLVDETKFVVAYFVVWADTKWRVFQLNNASIFSKLWTMRKPEKNPDSLSMWSDMLSVTIMSSLFGFHEWTVSRCKAMIARELRPVGGLVVKEWELAPFDWAKMDGHDNIEE
jgi:hypothetical protein